MLNWKLESNGAEGWWVLDGVGNRLFCVEAVSEDDDSTVPPRDGMEALRVAAQAAAGPALKHCLGQAITLLNALLVPGGLTERRVELAEAVIERGCALMREADALPPLDALQVLAQREVRRRIREEALAQARALEAEGAGVAA